MKTQCFQYYYADTWGMTKIDMKNIHSRILHYLTFNMLIEDGSVADYKKESISNKCANK